MFSLWRWRGRASRPLLGVDVNASGIRVVELTGRGKQLRMAHYGYRPLPQDALVDGGVLLNDAVADALRAAVSDSGSRVREAALALPAAAVISKTITVPASMDEEELELLVEAEAGDTLPFVRDEIGLDFASLGPSASQPDSTDATLVAARREKIDERVELARAAGLKPVIIDVETYALMAAVSLIDAARGAPSPQVIAILRLDRETTHCLFMLDGLLLQERQLAPVSLRDIAAADMLCQEFRRAQQLLHTATAFTELHYLYVVGAASSGLVAALGEQLHVPVSQPDPLRCWPGSVPDLSDGDTPSACLLACGLALRSFDA